MSKPAGNNVNERRVDIANLDRRISENTDLLRQHMQDTGQRFEDLTDMVTRVAHAAETTQYELNSHKKWEEGYHKEERKKDEARDEKFDKLIDDLSLYFKTRSTSKNAAELAAWLAKMGIFGIVLLWIWNNGIGPLLRKFGVF